MKASVLFLVDNVDLREKLASYLPAGKYAISTGPAIKTSAEVDSLVDFLLKKKPNLVVMDYQAEDEASVKVLQFFADRRTAIDFIFVDSYETANREKIMLAFNEGVGAFLTSDISELGFINAVSRVLNGSYRAKSAFINEDDYKVSLNREDQTRDNIRLTSAQKVVGYLLRTPLNAQQRKILVLSDSAYQRETLKKYLEDYNFVVTTATNFDEAVALALAEKPRIVISDYTLAESNRDGLDLCKALKFTHKLTPCFFVVCTANMDKFHVIMSPGNGVDECLLKPSPDTSLDAFITGVAAGLLL
ncbi:MAG: response regulator [Deltaproteobacteria bacterium]|jgi:DNA-binding response OmpR family regulator|nr:response regulator [Deltaproteobacteria bacterium]